MRPLQDKEIFEEMNKNPDNWKGYMFYFNRKDKRLFVPKRVGIGWTFNFASPYTYLILIGIVVIILILSKTI